MTDTDPLAPSDEALNGMSSGIRAEAHRAAAEETKRYGHPALSGHACDALRHYRPGRHDEVITRELRRANMIDADGALTRDGRIAQRVLGEIPAWAFDAPFVCEHCGALRDRGTFNGYGGSCARVAWAWPKAWGITCVDCAVSIATGRKARMEGAA